MERVTFLCELPPPFGGVTVKNQLILDAVVRSSDAVQVVDFCEIKRNPIKAISVFARMVSAFIRKDTIVYGFGSHSRLKQALTLQKSIGGKGSLGSPRGGAVRRKALRLDDLCQDADPYLLLQWMFPPSDSCCIRLRQSVFLV